MPKNPEIQGSPFLPEQPYRSSYHNAMQVSLAGEYYDFDEKTPEEERDASMDRWVKEHAEGYRNAVEILRAVFAEDGRNFDEWMEMEENVAEARVLIKKQMAS